MPLELPAHPNLTQLKKQAEDLKSAAASGDVGALARVEAAVPDRESEVTLRHAQLAIAREYGFDGWHDLSVEVGRRMVDQGDLHRWFGVQLNNDIWNVLDAGKIDPSSPKEERERLLYSAYASAYHWITAGAVANRARGEHLISRTALQAGMPDIALWHARRCLELVEGHPDETEDWDLAFALEALARAEAATGLPSAADTMNRAIGVAAAVADATERSIAEHVLASGPWFGLR